MDRQKVLGAAVARRPQTASRGEEGPRQVFPEKVIPELSCKGPVGRGSVGEGHMYLAGDRRSKHLELRIYREEAGVAGGSRLSKVLGAVDRAGEEGGVYAQVEDTRFCC